MSFLREALKIVEARDPLREDYVHHDGFHVSVPANVYDGKYYDARLVQVFVKASSPEQAAEWVNDNKQEVLDHIDKKRMRVGQRTVRYVKSPVEKNVKFKDDPTKYTVKPMSVQSHEDKAHMTANEAHDPYHNHETDLKRLLDANEMALLRDVIDGKKDLISQDALYNKLYTFFVHEMPIGTAKARDGDPDQWIIDHVEEYL